MENNQPGPYWRKDIPLWAQQFETKKPNPYLARILTYDADARDSQQSFKALHSSIQTNSFAMSALRKLRVHCKTTRLNAPDILALADHDIQMAYGWFMRSEHEPVFEAQLEHLGDCERQINALSTPLYPLDEKLEKATEIHQVAKNSGLLSHATTAVLLKYQDRIGCEAALRIATGIDAHRIAVPTFQSYRQMRDAFERHMQAFDYFVELREEAGDICSGERNILKHNKDRIWDLTMKAIISQAAGRGTGR